MRGSVTYQREPHGEGGVEFVVHPDERAGAAVVGSEVTASRLCHYTRSVVHIGDGTVQAFTPVRAPKQIEQSAFPSTLPCLRYILYLDYLLVNISEIIRV